jgi:hypothetical protein
LATSGGFEPYLRHSTKVDSGSPYVSLPRPNRKLPHNVDGNADGNRIPPHHTVSRQTPLKIGFLHRIPPYHAQRIGLRIRRPQVRVLPSAPLKVLQIAEKKVLLRARETPSRSWTQEEPPAGGSPRRPTARATCTAARAAPTLRSARRGSGAVSRPSSVPPSLRCAAENGRMPRRPVSRSRLVRVETMVVSAELIPPMGRGV